MSEFPSNQEQIPSDDSSPLSQKVPAPSSHESTRKDAQEPSAVQYPASTGRSLYSLESQEDFHIPLSPQEKIRAFPHARFAYTSVVFVFIAYQIAGAFLFISSTKRGISSTLPALMQGLGQLLFMLVPVYVLSRYTPLRAEGVFRLRGSVTPLQWLFGFLGVLAIQIFSSGFTSLQEHIMPYNIQEILRSFEQNFESLYRELLGGSSPWAVLRALLVGALIPAIAEESLFRGLFQRSLEEVRTPLKAMLITGVIFGAIHFNPSVFVPLSIFGVFLGFTGYYTQSLALPVVLHFFNNTLAIVAMYAADFHLTSTSPSLTIGQAIIFTTVGALMIVTMLILFISKTRQSEPENLFEE
jgi:membrane protease YdiL (CAAX protease family)